MTCALQGQILSPTGIENVNPLLPLKAAADLSFIDFDFQQLCGFEYTSKLQRMFQDMNVSRDLNDSFKKHLTVTEPLDSKYLKCVALLFSSYFSSEIGKSVSE